MTAIDQARMNIINLIMKIDDIKRLNQIEKGASIISSFNHEINKKEEDSLWLQLTPQQFINGYSEEDSVYDNL